MIGNFNDLDKLYHHKKFWEDRTTCTGCRFENMVFVTFLSVTLRGRSALRSGGGT